MTAHREECLRDAIHSERRAGEGRILRWVALATLISGTAPDSVAAEDRLVGPGETYLTIQAALDDAVNGDVVIVRAGTYVESIRTNAEGVTLRGEGEVVVHQPGRVVRIEHSGTIVESIVFDGEYGAGDTVTVEGADDVTLRDVEVRRSGRDCIDIRGGVRNITIEGALIHHCLRSTRPDCASDTCREDSHGIVADEIVGLTIQGTEIHTFSGDAIQLNGRDQPSLWDDVNISSCRFWLEPLPVAEGGFARGIVPGENAIDTKTPDEIDGPAHMTIVDTIASGFRNGLITNIAAFNMKENVEVVFDRVTVFDTDIAFRLRGAGGRPRGTVSTLRNVVIYDVDRAVRYEDFDAHEDDIRPVTLQNITLGSGIGRVFQDASAPDGVVSGQNVLVLASSLPAELSGGSNLAVDGDAFVDALAHDYHLADGSPAVDSGEILAAVTLDRDGFMRPVGAAYDVGAYERCDTCTAVDAGVPPRRDSGAPETDSGMRGRDAGTPSRDVDSGTTTGCGCRVGGPRPTEVWLWLVAGVGLLRRRVRSRHFHAPSRDDNRPT